VPEGREGNVAEGRGRELEVMGLKEGEESMPEGRGKKGLKEGEESMPEGRGKKGLKEGEESMPEGRGKKGLKEGEESVPEGSAMWWDLVGRECSQRK
jgi:hypothetical protein